MRYLVTGGAGFIGSAVARHVVQNLSLKAIVLDKLTYASNIKYLSSIKNKIWFHPQHLEVYKKAFSEYEFDESAMKNTANLFSRCKEHNWDRVLLTQDRAILDRFDHLNQLVNLF